MIPTEKKMKIMAAYLEGKVIQWHNGENFGTHKVKDEKEDCAPIWNWGETDYKISVKPVCVEKYTNVMDNNIYGLFATEKEAIFHSDNRYHRPGVKVLITEVIDD